MHVRLLFPKEYLAADDLIAAGSDVTLTISALKQETVHTEKGADVKWVIHFAEMEKRPEDKRKKLILNKTNATTIAELHGTETNDWIGKRITLFASRCQAFGEIVDCLRIRPGESR